MGQENFRLAELEVAPQRMHAQMLVISMMIAVFQ